MTALDTKQSSSADSPCPDCSAFLKWKYNRRDSESEKAVVLRSLVATVKSQPAFDVNLEAKAVKFLKSVDPDDGDSADAFLRSFASNSDDSPTDFIKSMIVLVSSTSQAIIKSSMKMLLRLTWKCSAEVHYTLMKADLISQLVVTLNPHSLSFAEAEDIHINLIHIINNQILLATPDGLTYLRIEDEYGQQAVCKTVLQQVLTPSEKYIRHLCTNRFSIVHGDFSTRFLLLLPALLQISPFYQRTMDFVFHMPIILTIPSCLTFFENDEAIFDFLYEMNVIHQKWNKQCGEVQQIGKKVHQMLRMEGIEDVIEKRLRNDKSHYIGNLIVGYSIGWKNQQGLNLSGRL
ncbi:hypothetical protein BLNAU_16222 [Blattamonas nauphoetae]|uniref:Uncharacterized protein n=1 Tax=Blattamonas nauphoetae TaxID=2049346 RepID=A0ABQ9XDD0_9EUKA|nr:hypothetical protein BLNAU_16222 [Blattamonas nauphoetae]